MPHAASLSQSSAQTRKLSPVIAGLGAAAIASAITLVMVMSNAAPQASAEQAVTANQCKQVARKLMVASGNGGGVVRLREGSYLSAPITLSTTPQSVVFPLARPELSPATEVLTIEGDARGVVITSDVTSFRKVLDVSGVSAFSVSWAPLKTC